MKTETPKNYEEEIKGSDSDSDNFIPDDEYAAIGKKQIEDTEQDNEELDGSDADKVYPDSEE